MVETNDIAQLKAMILAQQEEITTLRGVIAGLEARLSLNSTNSHKPSSTDGYAKKPLIKPALPKQEGRKVGGQLGHTGKTLQIVSHPDAIEQHRATSCPDCGTNLTQPAAEQIVARRQVFELPQPRLLVTEHQLLQTHCQCGCIVVGQFPATVLAPAQYGSRVLALSSLLNVHYRIPFGKISQLMSDLFGYRFNESSATTANTHLYERLNPIEAQIRTALTQSEVVHADETGLRVAGKLHWVHVACTVLLTYLFVHPKRGKKAIESAQSPLLDCVKWLIHDCWQSYFPLTKARHGLCGAHLVRELQALVEQGSKWAQQMQTFLLDLYKATRQGPIELTQHPQWQVRYEAICQEGFGQEPPPAARSRGKPKQSKGRNLLNRLVLHQASVLAFGFELGVPFSNNQAERDLRPVKTKQKVSGCFRTKVGADEYARIAGFVSTMRKNEQDVLAQLTNIFSGSFTWRPT